MKDFTHAYCKFCKRIQRVERDDIATGDKTDEFVRGDIACAVCGSVLLMVYVRHQRRAS